MKRLVIVAFLIFVGFAGWRAGGILSSDAMGMVVGILFGVLASLPAALLVLAATRRSQQAEPPSVRSQPPYANGQIPVVIVAPPAYPGYGQPAGNHFAQLSAPHTTSWAASPQPARPERAFTMIGEQAEHIDDW